ncbi:fluoride efflux transporter CrcB [Polymorphobacter fuscus]|uniref:Fluoride-specific ion channel FluC n=1 Tax=Sandarakinorhabdus fusca TaxID=1439888 RepID=A0A7C9KIQ8_9SPHN|nr:fluoride efflux transporter CrcB [Polymorphobacter fuscus]KAB7646533.1 fluoride efflux transporter CrcB [Polymorphobacter fuscus]MQT17780.1 fluoride efflux transporter CrcB [Polymorphobacter fuscus]NJC09672.1 CrcB protein [Polymorphobacter fuscus]
MPALSSIPPLALVAFGGAFGACMRYLVGRWTMMTLGIGLPYGTWTVNIVGGLAMGLLAGWLTRIDSGSETLRLLLGVGVLGGFTTFSAFSLDIVTMINRNEIGLAAAYAVSSVAGSVLALMAGVWLARA